MLFCFVSKGDFDGAITQYILTIGKLEPSYVIRKVEGRQHYRLAFKAPLL